MDNLIINWFDIIAVTFLIAGICVGRKRGMALELPDLVMWALIVFLGGFLYESLGQWLSSYLGIGLLGCHVAAYLVIAGVIAGCFYALKRFAGEKMLGANTFGRMEYYFGMAAGGVRFLLILLFLMALFHAPQISDADLAKQVKAQNESLGAIYFPPYGMIQRSVFRKSCTGRLIDEYLGRQMVQVYTRDTGGQRSNDSMRARRQRELDELTR